MFTFGYHVSLGDLHQSTTHVPAVSRYEGLRNLHPPIKKKHEKRIQNLTKHYKIEGGIAAKYAGERQHGALVSGVAICDK